MRLGLFHSILIFFISEYGWKDRQFISEGQYFFPDFSTIFGFTHCQKLQCAVGNTTFITACVQSGSREFEVLLGKNIISRILLANCCLTEFHKKNSIYDANSLCVYFVKKAAEIMVAYSELLPETDALQLHNYNFGMV